VAHRSSFWAVHDNLIAGEINLHFGQRGRACGASIGETALRCRVAAPVTPLDEGAAIDDKPKARMFG
jgi:hypothetical protein